MALSWRDRATELNRVLVNALVAWFAENPEHAQADAYYNAKLKVERIIDVFDLAIAQCLLDNVPAGSIVVEAGAGYGQLSILLATLGYKTFPIDMQLSRHHGCKALCAASGVGSDCVPVLGPYPAAAAALGYRCVVGTNTIHGTWAKLADTDLRRWAIFTGHAQYCVFDIERTGVHRPAQAEISAALDECTLLGYAIEKVAVPELSSSHVYLLEQK